MADLSNKQEEERSCSLLIRNRLHYSPDVSCVTLLVLVVPDAECDIIRTCLEDLSYNIEHAKDFQCSLASTETVDEYIKTHWRKYVVYEDQVSWKEMPTVQPYVASVISRMYILS